MEKRNSSENSHASVEFGMCSLPFRVNIFAIHTMITYLFMSVIIGKSFMIKDTPNFVYSINICVRMVRLKYESINCVDILIKKKVFEIMYRKLEGKINLSIRISTPLFLQISSMHILKIMKIMCLFQIQILCGISKSSLQTHQSGKIYEKLDQVKLQRKDLFFHFSSGMNNQLL